MHERMPQVIQMSMDVERIRRNELAEILLEGLPVRVRVHTSMHVGECDQRSVHWRSVDR
jgi:hypothetical protein